MRRTVGEPRATERVARTITLVTLAAAVFLGVTSIAAIGRSTDYLRPEYTVFAVVGYFGGILVLAAVCLVARMPVIRFAHGAYAVVFLLVQLAWAPSLLMATPPGLNPWVLEMGAIGAAAAAIAWRPWIAWSYLGAMSVLVAPIRFASTGGSGWLVPLQYALLTFTLAAVFTALVIVTMRNAETVDAALRDLQQTAARSAATRARAQEEARLDALVHDEIMSTLFYASRGDEALDASVRAQARAALSRLERLRSGRAEERDGISPDDVVSRLRSVVLDASLEVEFVSRCTRTEPVPSAVSDAFAEATSEAVRNTLTHGRADALRRVSVTLAPDGARVRIDDSGDGFDPRDVPPQRLGILMSIRGRLSAVPGGSATVSSAPGAGTTVDLRWEDR